MRVTVRWCNTCLMITQHAVGCTVDTVYSRLLHWSTDMEYAHKLYITLSPIGACATVQPVLWHMLCTILFDIIQDTNDSWWSGQQHLQEVTFMAHVNAGCRQAVQSAANKDNISAGVAQQLWSSYKKTKQLGISEQIILKVFHTTQLHPHHYSCRTHSKWSSTLDVMLCLAKMNTSYTKFCTHINTKHIVYVRCVQHPQVISGLRINHILSTNGGIKFASLPMFGLAHTIQLVVMGHNCYLIYDITILWKKFHLECLRCT